MSEKMYLKLLFFFGIFCQGIFTTLSVEVTRLSSDFLVRKRRVITHLSGGAAYRNRMEEANYIVKVKEGTHPVCAGVILSNSVVLTAALCVPLQISVYKVLSGATIERHAKVHNVSSKLTYSGNPPHHEFESIALITVDPLFVYTGRTRNIQLHTGLLPAGTMVTVFGYGHLYPIQPGTERRQKLHYITLPIMNHQECRSVYLGRFGVTDKHICTYCEQQYCARGDAGAPLVVVDTIDKLAAIHVWKGELQGLRNPDVYINLLRSDYNRWIREHAFL